MATKLIAPASWSGRTLSFVFLSIVLVAMLIISAINPAMAQSRQPSSSIYDETLVVQRLLNATGYSVGEINGVMTPQTRAAIRSFQRRNFLRETGRVDLSLMTFLAAYAVDLLPSSDTVDLVETSGSVDDAIDLQSRQTIAFVQRTLTRHGFEPGRIDGIETRETQQAIRNFQSMVDLEVTGVVSEELLVTLGEFDEVTREFAAERR